MAADFGRGTLWDAALFNLETTESVQFDGHYPTAPLDPTISLNDCFLRNKSSSVIEVTQESSTEWHRQKRMWTTPTTNIRLVDSPQSNEPFEKSKKILIEPQPQTRRRRRRAPSGEALERRRQQNRAAQLAFRERSKKQVEDMRQELTQCVEYNQKMYSTMRELLGRTEALKMDTEGALALQPPLNYSLESESASRTTSVDPFASPTSSSESPIFDYDAGGNF